MISDLNRSLGSRHFPSVMNLKEKFCIVGERAHLKVPDWSLVWSELVTKNLPMFLSRLN